MSSKTKPHITVSSTSSWPLKRRVYVIGGLVLALLIIVAVVFWIVSVVANDHTVKTVNTANQKTLEATLQNAQSGPTSNPSDVVNAAGQLISGATSKKFSLNNSDLSNDYLQRATAYMNLKQYAPAASDFNNAIKLDNANKVAGLQGYIESEYYLGERKQLIPFYQQLIDQEKTQTDNPFAGSDITRYQAAIASLEKGQDISAYEN